MIQMADMVSKKYQFISLNARLNSASAVPFATSFWDDFSFFSDSYWPCHLHGYNNKQLTVYIFNTALKSEKSDTQKSASASNRPWMMKALACCTASQICHFLPALLSFKL